MEAAILIIITLQFDGHWFGGQPQAINITWADPQNQRDSVLKWQLSYGDEQLANGQVVMSDNQASTVRLTLPQVRVRTALRWSYQLYQRGGATLLTTGETAITLYPQNLLSGISETILHPVYAIAQEDDQLVKLLATAPIECQRLVNVSTLSLVSPRIVLVATDYPQLGGFMQSDLHDLARGGASVMLFRQSRQQELMGFTLTYRATSDPLAWRITHPLLAGFTPDNLQRWLAPTEQETLGVQLPTDDASLEIAYWPAQDDSHQDASIDALLVTKSVGRGRIVLCQLPWDMHPNDPRSHLFLSNILNYLATPANPTPPPSQRHPLNVQADESATNHELQPGGIP